MALTLLAHAIAHHRGVLNRLAHRVDERALHSLYIQPRPVIALFQQLIDPFDGRLTVLQNFQRSVRYAAQNRRDTWNRTGGAPLTHW